MLHITIEQVDSRAEGFLMATIEDATGIYVPALRGEECFTVTANSYTPVADFIRQIADGLANPGWVAREKTAQREAAERFNAEPRGDLPF